VPSQLLVVASKFEAFESRTRTCNACTKKQPKIFLVPSFLFEPNIIVTLIKVDAITNLQDDWRN